MTKRPRRGYDPQARLHLYAVVDTAFDDPAVVEPGSNPTESETSLVRSSALVAVGTMLSRVTGFVRIAAIAYALGVDHARRHLQLRQRDPEHRLRAAARRRAHRDPRTAVRRSTTRRTTTTRRARSSPSRSSLLAGITVVGILLAPVDRRPLHAQRARARTSPSSRQLATDLLRLFMPQMLFYGIVTLATAMLNARRRFAAAAFAPMLNNVVVIAVFLALPRVADGSLTVHGVLDDDAARCCSSASARRRASW